MYLLIICVSQIITFQICLHLYNKYYNDDDQNKLDDKLDNEELEDNIKRDESRSSIFDRATTLIRKSFSSISMSRITLSDTIQTDNLLSMRTQEALPPSSEWTNYPIFLCANNIKSEIMTEPKYHSGACPLSMPVHFETDLFQGKAFIRLRDVPSENLSSDKEYFHGCTRRFLTRVQGRFKVPDISVSDVYTGHEFIAPFERLPYSLIKKMVDVIDVDVDECKDVKIMKLDFTEKNEP